jgi:ppGpp synthetase/RelA/SpoT-type nucleotidyltranferase
MPHVPTVSKSQANKAGREWRKLAVKIFEAPDEDAQVQLMRESGECINRIAAYRLMHEYPLRKVTMGVRRMTETSLGDGAPRPSQRFKRMERIMYKLLRHPNMALSTMQDIGGCRVVFEDLDQLRHVEHHIVRSARWRDSRIEDYIVEPKADGYRSVHIVTKRDDRWIEVQLRTRRQESWATAVEEAQSLTGHDVKDGEGPDDLRRYFKLAARRLALEDHEAPVDQGLEEEFRRVRKEIEKYYERT